MVKHNNVVPNIHCHKKWAQSSRGPLKVRLALNQAPRKKVRRLARAKKAAAAYPAPIQKLRPIVQCQTQKYSAKSKLGRGFTLEELRAVKLNAKYARTIGIAVDHRRINKSEESLEVNTNRLKTYLASLVILKKGEDGSAMSQFKGTIQPLDHSKGEIEMADLTDDLKSFNAYTTMRVAKKETKVLGFRASVANRKDKK